ncbi:restriction endonuclease fold toxin-2 domain-containing protein [Streptomyces orinoci]|uniref:Restriction endonuclease fold toxin-2 domain-containing protein n=1 Tax=Streptomyces orinoci TaxID=67339 RepID=A0ABV3K1T5_STRON|nr:restriction endonuclease fold toxin-2 domain-containing protein [Streptomyces orinoci]
MDDKLRLHAIDLIDTSWGMHTLNEMLVETVNALVAALSGQKGMAGDDDAGHAFATLYNSAARTAVNQLGQATDIMGRGSATTLQVANRFMAHESKFAANMLRAIGQSGAAPRDGAAGQPNCTPAPLGQGEDLPEVQGGTTAATQYLFGDRFRGSPEKLEDVANAWRMAKDITARVLSDAQDCWRTATRSAQGETADAVNAFFNTFVGKDHPPAKVHESSTLLANLPAACDQIAKACEKYADHIRTANRRAPYQQGDDLLSKSGLDKLLDDPRLGGNGEDGGLHTAVTSDDHILDLASLGHTLDASQARVPVPKPDTSPFGSPPAPFLPFIPEPFMVPVGYKPPVGSIAARPPVAPPVPPDPRFPPLTPAERKKFDAWANTLRDSHYAGGTPDDNAYQYRVAGYPEKEIPIDPSLSPNGTILADGLRSTDGMAVEAKNVREPGCGRTFRTLEKLQKADRFQRNVLMRDDYTELVKYKSAMEHPPNGGQVRGLEIDTNDANAVPYWDALMAAHEVKGYARYVP